VLAVATASKVSKYNQALWNLYRRDGKFCTTVKSGMEKHHFLCHFWWTDVKSCFLDDL